LITLPPAGVLGIGALLGGRRADKDSRRERLIETSDVAWLPGPPASGNTAVPGPESAS
jgi:hypothetical protein